MAIKNTNLRNVLAEAWAGEWDGATLEIKDSSNNVLATFTLPSPAFSSGSNGTVTMLGGDNQVNASDDGEASHATLTSDDENSVQDQITVGTSNAMAIINSTNIVQGQPITLQSISWTETSGFTA